MCYYFCASDALADLNPTHKVDRYLGIASLHLVIGECLSLPALCYQGAIPINLMEICLASIGKGI